MNLKALLAKQIPTPLLNNFLLTFSFLYKTKFLNYESYVDEISINELTNGIEKVQNLSGDIIECGCARCGTTCILANYLKNNNIKKKIYALDSFEGFDEIELKQENELGFVVGETPGGAFDGVNAGPPMMVELPNSKIRLYYRIIGTRYNVEANKVSTKVDFKVDNTLESFRNGKDLQLEYALYRTKE